MRNNRYLTLWGLAFILAIVASISLADRIMPSTDTMYQHGHTAEEMDTITIHRRVIVSKVYNVEYLYRDRMPDQEVCDVALSLDLHPDDSSLYYRGVYVTRDSVCAELRCLH